MTREEEAIEEIQKFIGWFKTDSRIYKALEMAIQALKKENIYDDKEHYVTISKALYDKLNIDYEALSQEPCDDAISRKAVFNAIEHEDKWLLAAKGHNGLTEIAFSGLKGRIDALLPVTQKSGKWIKVKSGDKDFPESIVCSRCGNENSHLDFNENAEPIGKVFITSKYCPSCGSRMTGGLSKNSQQKLCLKQDLNKERQTGECKNCKYFEYDSVAKVDGVPFIVAHEICNKWGDGCKTSEDGYCYLFEPRESEG